MPKFDITVIKPLPEGTPVYDVNSGKPVLVGYSNSWNVRWRVAAKGGCPSWIDQIVVGANQEVLNRTNIRAVEVPSIASSSKSSRDVIATFLDEDGNEDRRALWPFVYVPRFKDSGVIDKNTGKDIPIALELWFSSRAVNDDLVLRAEGDCNHSL